MIAKLKKAEIVIPMSKYEYDSMINRTTYITYKNLLGYYIPSLHI